MNKYTKLIIDICTERNCSECRFNEVPAVNKIKIECGYCDNKDNWEPDYEKVINKAKYIIKNKGGYKECL